MFRTKRTYVAALAVCAMAAVMVAEPAVAAKAGNWKKWTKKDDKKKKDKEGVHAKEIERLASAAEAVEKEEAAVQKALAKAETEAAKKAADDPVQRERLVTTARRKAVAALEVCGAKYARVVAVAQPIARKADLRDKSKTALQTLAAKLSMLRRSNVEHVANLYEKMGKDRRCLGILEAYYRSIPERRRFAAMALKDRIDTLKAKLNPKRRAGGTR